MIYNMKYKEITQSVFKLKASEWKSFLKSFASGVSPFTRAKPGKPCIHPVSSKEDCQKAEEFFPDAVYAISQQAGHGLPYGCISDKVTSGKHYLYWNPLGVTKSYDPNLQQICKTKMITGMSMSQSCLQVSHYFFLD